VAIIGTGNMASAMGPNVAEAGYPVVYGSRDPDRPEVRELVERTGPGTRALDQESAAREGEIIVLAVPWDAMEAVIGNLGDVSGKVLLDFSGSDRPGPDGYMESGVETSTSEVIQGWVPDALVVKTGVPSVYLMEDPDFLGTPPTVMLASDSRFAKEAAGRLFYDIGLDPFDAGPLRNARAVAAFGRLFWVPLLQGREQGIEIRLMRSSYWPCTWDVQETFGRPSDVDDLAELPAQGEPLPCEVFRRP
jgi:predicted dinucleotide-binding enzyme